MLTQSVAVSAQPASSRFSEFDAFVTRTLAQYRVPGAAVVVVESGKVAFIKGYGVRNVTKPGRVDENTIFQLASVTKTLTGASAATVVDDGKLAWDTPVVHYLPEFVAYDPYATRNMTMRDLLAMRTGWPQFTGDKLDDFGYTRSEILHRVRYLKPAYSFREVSQYSNLGYFTAGEVAAHAAGMSWNNLVRTRIYAPLGMTRSGTSVHDLADPDSATPHAIVNGAVAPTNPSNQDTMGAAGAATSTAADMGHYLEFFLGDGRYGGKTILESATVAELFKRSMVGKIEFTELPPISDRTGFYYGLGFDSYDYSGSHVVEKAGALAGIRTLITMVPEKHDGIVILSNLNLSAFPEAVRTYYIEKMVLGRSPDTDLREIVVRNDNLMKMLDPPKRPANAAAFTGNLDGLVGTYENPMYGRCSIARHGAGLELLCGPARIRAPLDHWNGGEFLARWAGATNVPDEITFTIGAGGIANSYTDDPLGVFTRVKPR